MSSQKKNQLIDLYQESFLAIPRSVFDSCLLFKGSFSSTFLIYLFSYFSSETGQNKTYKRVVVYKLAREFAEKACKQTNTPVTKKVIKSFDSLIRRAIVEISTSDTFLIADCSDKGVLFFIPTEKNKALFKEAKDKKMKVDIDIQVTEKIVLVETNNVIEFPNKNIKNDSTFTGNDFSHTGNDSTFTGNDFSHTGNGTNAETFDWSSWETDLKKAQEVIFKEALFKESFIQEEKSTEVSNEKKLTSKENDLNEVVYKNSNLVKEDSSKNDKQENPDLTKQKVIDQMTKTFIETCQKESSACAVSSAPVGPAGEKSQDVIELEDKLHSLGVKEEVYLKALGCHGYEKVKSIYDDMYKCLSFQKLNDLEPIRNKGLYLSQRFEKLDNPEIKLSFICNAYEESKVCNQDIVIVNDNEPKIYQNKELMNKVLNAISIKTFLSFKTSNNYYKAVEIIKSIFGSYEISIKKPDTEEQRKSLEFAHEMAQKFNPNIGPLLTYEEKQAENIAFIKRFKSNFDVNELKLLIDLFKKFSSYMSYQKELLNDFIVWFEGV